MVFMILKELQTSGGTGWSVVDAKSFTASNILAPVLSGHHIHKRRLSGRQQKTWSMLHTNKMQPSTTVSLKDGVKPQNLSLLSMTKEPEIKVHRGSTSILKTV